MTETVLVDISDHIMTITINRPDARNAIDFETAHAIARAVDELEADETIRVGVLTGAGGTFCAGADLKGFVEGKLPIVPGRGFAGIAERPPRKPMIAAIEGYALAGGFELAIACDLIVAADSAKFGIPEVKRGLAAGAGGLLRLPRKIPINVAMELALTGEFISSQRAYELGLVNRIVEKGTALDAAIEMASVIASNGPMAVSASKTVVQQSRQWADDEMFEKQSVITDSVFASEDAMEGAKAFAEKRAPVWKGR